MHPHSCSMRRIYKLFGKKCHAYKCLNRVLCLEQFLCSPNTRKGILENKTFSFGEAFLLTKFSSKKVFAIALYRSFTLNCCDSNSCTITFRIKPEKFILKQTCLKESRFLSSPSITTCNCNTCCHLTALDYIMIITFD